jgi:hypothetical protein
MSAFTATGNTVNLAVTIATGNVALGTLSSPGGATVRIHNAGSATAFIEFGPSSAIVAALATSMPVPAGLVEAFTINPGITHMAAITASGTATIYATPGQGE